MGYDHIELTPRQKAALKRLKGCKDRARFTKFCAGLTADELAAVFKEVTGHLPAQLPDETRTRMIQAYLGLTPPNLLN